MWFNFIAFCQFDIHYLTNQKNALEKISPQFYFRLVENLLIFKSGLIGKSGIKSRTPGFLHIDFLMKSPSSINVITCRPARWYFIFLAMSCKLCARVICHQVFLHDFEYLSYKSLQSLITSQIFFYNLV